MRENTLRSLFDRGEQAVGGWMSTDSAYLAEALAQSGFDCITVDLQHGMFGTGSAIRLLQAISSGPAIPIARCPSLDPAIIGKLLDAGAYGIICPSIDTAAQARSLVEACRYSPDGARSFGPSRGLLYGGPDYFARANETVLVFAMIESATALANLEEIVATPGLDAVYVGPNDLALSLGETPGRFPAPEPVMRALRTIVGTAHRAGVRAGSFCADVEMARDLLSMGYDLVTPGSDLTMVREAASARVSALRGAAPAGTSGGY